MLFRSLAWRNAVPFGRVDPVLGLDISFFVFTMPLLQIVRGLGQALVLIAAVASAAIYLISGSLGTGFPARMSLAPGARRHLGLLAALFLLLLALSAWLGRAEQLVRGTSLLYGASYADVTARMPAALVLTAVSLVGAGLALVHAYSRRQWPIPMAIGLYVMVLFGGEVYSSMLQRFVVTPNEQARESPYIAHNIEATRHEIGRAHV